MRTHVRDGGCLAGGPGSGDRGEARHRLGPPPRPEAPADLARRTELPPTERPSPGYAVSHAVVAGRLQLEQRKDVLRAVRRPRGHESSVLLTERLR